MDDSLSSSITCGCGILMLIFNFFIGGWSVNYLLVEFLGKNIPFWGSCLIGMFAGEISVPLAVVVWILKYFGIM